MSIDTSVPLEWHVSKGCVRTDANVNFCGNVPSKHEKRCRRRAEICTFCDGAINDEVRTLFSYPICYKSFCKDAEHLHGLWKKWGQLGGDRDAEGTVARKTKSDLQRFRSLKDLRLKGTAFRETDDETYDKRYDSKRSGRYRDDNQNWKDDDYEEKTKSRLGSGKKVDGSRFDEAEEKVKGEKRRFEGKEENSRGKVLGGKGQENLGKMIHDRTGKKKSPPRHRGGNEIESEETSPRGGRRRRKTKEGGETEESRQRGGSRGKKGDAVDRLSGRADRHGDEEKKFLKSREKRKKSGEGNENKVKNRDLPSGKKHRTGYKEPSRSTEGTNDKIFELDTEKSTLNFEVGDSTEGNDRMRARSRGRKLTGLNLTTEEEFEKTSGSRRRSSKLYATGCQNEIGSPNKIEYQLSNEHFANLGWTVFPIRKIMRKMFLYDAQMAKPHLNWFKKYRYGGRKYYEDGLTPFLIFRPDATGEVFYPNGRIAVKVDRPQNRECN